MEDSETGERQQQRQQQQQQPSPESAADEPDPDEPKSGQPKQGKPKPDEPKPGRPKQGKPKSDDPALRDPVLIGSELRWNGFRFRRDEAFWLTAVDDTLGIWRLEEVRPGAWTKLFEIKQAELERALRTEFRLVRASSAPSSPPAKPPTQDDQLATRLKKELGKPAPARQAWATAVLATVKQHLDAPAAKDDG